MTRILCPNMMLLKILVILCCMCAYNGQQRQSTETNGIPDTVTDGPELHARQFWMQTEKDLKSLINMAIKKAMPIVLREVYRKDISASCLNGLLQFVSALKNMKTWAFQILDSSGRLPEGFLSGTLTSLGNYQECIDIKVNETKVKLQGQYCQLEVKPPLPTWKPFTSLYVTVPELLNISSPGTVITYLAGFIHDLHVTSIKIGICTPSLCSKEDISKLVQIIPDKIGRQLKLDVLGCETKHSVQFTQPQVVILYIFGIVALLVLLGTIADMVWSSECMEKSSAKAILFHVMKSFSLPSNSRKLSNYAPQENLRFLCGLIFLIFLWNVISNTFVYVNYDVAANILEALRILKHIFFQIALNRIFPLQALLFISGFIITYKWLQSPEKSLNVWKFLLKRYWRFTPAYLLVLAFVIMMSTFGSGPAWQRVMDPTYSNCKNNWWYNILYINNFLYGEQTCLYHLWVYAVDAQLYILAICILIPLKQRPKIGLMVNFALGVGSLASVALTNVYYDLPPHEMTAFLHEKDRLFYAEHSYFRVYSHISMYCAGVFVGYLMNKYPDMKISRKTSVMLWIITTTGCMAGLCTVYEWREGGMPSPLISALYATLSKIAELAFLSWLTIACMTGHGGGLKDFLSWRPFAFFARITFIAYIIHVPIITTVMAFKKSHIFIAELEIFYMVLSHLGGSYIIAYLLYLFFEAPLVSLTDVVAKRCKGKTFNTAASSSNDLITEKPVKYSDKKQIEANNKYWLNSLPKSNC